MPASVAAKLAGVRADSSIFYYLDGYYAWRSCVVNLLLIKLVCLLLCSANSRTKVQFSTHIY